MSSTNLTIFKVISNFTTELDSVFGSGYKPLKLYAHLINKTTIVNDRPIQKHVDAFRSFCVENHNAIVTKNSKLIEKPIISYSKRVFIDMSKIFSKCDKETEEVVWKHLLTISAMVDPTSKAKDILKQLSGESKNQDGKEINFLEDIINRVEGAVDPNSNNPMEAISGIMSSGIFTDLVSGMGDGLQNGDLDLNKLLGTVQKMVSKLGAESGQENDESMNIMNTMLSNLKVDDSISQGGQPDIGQLLMPVMGMLTNSGGVEQSLPNLAGLLAPNSLPSADDMLTIEEADE